MIRQCVLWLARLELSQALPQFGDPVNLLEQSYANNPELERLEQFLMDWHQTYQDREKTIAEVLRDFEGAYSGGGSYGITNELLSDISGGNKPNSRPLPLL